MTKSSIDISIIVTAHNEGILAHKTMLSLFRAVRKLEEAGITYEIIVHIDNGSKETVDYFERYENDDRVRVLRNTFGDLSESRNFSVNSALGKYIAVIDADDLCSEGWLANSYTSIKDRTEAVARYSYTITFGNEETVVTDNEDVSLSDKNMYLFDSNMNGSSFVCRKEIYQDTPQRKNTPPYGSEDWQWTVDTMSKGIEHIAVPETAHFYRKDPLAKPSLLASQSVSRASLSYSEFFNFDKVRQIEVPELEQSNGSVSEADRIYRGIKRRLDEKIYHAMVYANSFKTYKGVKKMLRRGTKRGLPSWLIQEWKDINKIEKTTFPTQYNLDNLIWWTPNIHFGETYVMITKQLTKQPDTLFFVPWLIRGGADKVFINTVNEIVKNHPDWSVAMMQTLRHNSLWQDKLSPAIDFVDIARILKDLDYEHQMRLMALFVTQNHIKRIIIGNSRFAYDFVLRYKVLIRHLGIKVYAFAFTETINFDGRIGDYIHENIPFIQDTVYRIVTDNTSIVDQLYDEHAISKEKVFVHHQFLNNAFEKPRVMKRHPLRILWASRVNIQKTPEVLREIGKRLSDDFVVDAYGQLENHYTTQFFRDSGVAYIRPFDGIDDLPIEDYDIFLYTSNADGMPNMLLEIASKGLPIVAPDVGGIKDFIRDGVTGLLVNDHSDADQFVAALEKMKDSELRLTLAKNAQALLESDFNEAAWKDGVKRIFDK